MSTPIKCPKCANEFDVEDVLYAEVEQKIKTENQEKLNSELDALRAQKDRLTKEREEFDEKKRNENELFAQKVQQERQKIQIETRKEIEKESGNKLKFLEEQTANAERKIKELEEKELEALRLKNENEELKRNAENEKRKYLLENTPKIIQDALSKEKEQFGFEKKALELKLDQQKRLIEEMERKVNQGSMQLQGEVQELLLEEILQNAFTFDIVGEVPKGKKGADCLLTVRNKFGNDCGKILFESKRTVNWSKDWIEKLKQDAVNCNADIAVLVSQALPDKMDDRFEFRDGILICSFQDVKIVATLLREGIIRTFTASKSQEGKGDKMQMLYDYMTSNEFASQWRAVSEVFRNMKLSIDDERKAMEKLWKNREKQLERALLNSNHIIGAIEGIAGKNTVDLNLLEEGDEDDMAH